MKNPPSLGGGKSALPGGRGLAAISDWAPQWAELLRLTGRNGCACGNLSQSRWRKCLAPPRAGAFAPRRRALRAFSAPGVLPGWWRRDVRRRAGRYGVRTGRRRRGGRTSIPPLRLGAGDARPADASGFPGPLAVLTQKMSFQAQVWTRCLGTVA